MQDKNYHVKKRSVNPFVWLTVRSLSNIYFFVIIVFVNIGVQYEKGKE